MSNAQNCYARSNAEANGSPSQVWSVVNGFPDSQPSTRHAAGQQPHRQNKHHSARKIILPPRVKRQTHHSSVCNVLKSPISVPSAQHRRICGVASRFLGCLLPHNRTVVVPAPLTRPHAPFPTVCFVRRGEHGGTMGTMLLCSPRFEVMCGMWRSSQRCSHVSAAAARCMSFARPSLV